MTSINSVTGSPTQQVTTPAGGAGQTANVGSAAGAPTTKAAVDRRQDGPRAGDPPPGNRGDFPPLPPAGPPVEGPAFGQATLDKAFTAMESLEKEMAGIDPTSPEGSKKMMEIERKLQRVDQLITMITNLRRMVHEMNMHAIRSIVG